jgi:hypothetical protein
VCILVLPNLTWSKSSFTRGTLILCQSHHGVWACMLGLATMSGSDAMDLTLEYRLSSVCVLLWSCPVILVAQAAAF